MINPDQLVSVLGNSLAASSGEVRFCCPKCIHRSSRRTADTKYHLYINLHKEVFCCHKCQWAGPLRYLLTNLGVSDEPEVSNWGKMIRKMRTFTGEEWVTPKEGEVTYPCDTLPIINGSGAYIYLVERNVSEADIAFYQLVVGTGRFRNRIFIPTFDSKNLLSFWVARQFRGESSIKYLNPLNLQRRNQLFNYNRVKKSESILITEGVFSSMAAGRSAVATFGKFVTKEQVKLLLTSDAKTFYVALDGDAKKQAVALAETLHSAGRKTYLVDLPYEHDPASVENFPQFVENSKEFSFLLKVSSLMQ